MSKENNNFMNDNLILLLIPLLLKYHKEISAFIRIVIEILIELKREIVLQRKRKQEIHEAKVLKLELIRKQRSYESANQESLRRIKVYIERRKKEMAGELNEEEIKEQEEKLGKVIFSKIKDNKKLSVGVAALLLVLLSSIPQLAHYKFVVYYCEDKTVETTCELVSEDLSEGISNLLGAFGS